ncbi:IclR family transcriptional regulator [Lichenihabitans psoromatis]|uniref:IclR family transcriptional regulator n=1 Tax=Lichenihabitans psoromatis TaxID=2528642 RepID=UPI0010383710|nr:IclR family transcriptional regulator [Lichenihabitans psoromatis]
MLDRPLTSEERRLKYSVPAVEKALDVIEYLSDQAVPVPQAQIARAVGRNAGEIFRMLTCLESRGYLRRDAASGGYALTLKLFELSRTHSPYEGLLRAAQPHMRKLAETIRESCHLSVFHNGQVLVLAQEESPRPFRLSVEVGSLHSPLHTTSGRVLLAALSDAERDALLGAQPEWQKKTRRAKADLTARLDAIRASGIERQDGERFIGGLDLGVLIGSAKSAVKAALTVAALKEHADADLESVLPALRDCAEAIMRDIGLTQDKHL